MNIVNIERAGAERCIAADIDVTDLAKKCSDVGVVRTKPDHSGRSPIARKWVFSMRYSKQTP